MRNETQPLAGKVAIVTGGATGIGRSVVLALARAGADVAFTHLRHDPADVVRAVEALGRRVLAAKLDATSSSDVASFVAGVADELGRIDVLVNNAGGLIARHALEDVTDAFWHQVLDVNLSSTFYFIRETVRHIGHGGRIVSISSLAGHNGGGNGAAAYATSKAAIDGLTRSLAKELATRGITVNAVAPGFILDTPFHEEFTPHEAQKAAIAGIPLGRAGTPDDVAGAVLYLVSPDAGFCTGVVLGVNGGSYFG